MIWKYEFKELNSGKLNKHSDFLFEQILPAINNGWAPVGNWIAREERSDCGQYETYTQVMGRKHFILFYWLKKLFIRIT